MDCSGARLSFLKVGVQCRCGGCQASLERDLSTSTEMHRAPPTWPLDAPGGMGRKYPTDCRTIHQNKTHGVRVVLTPECLGAVQQQLSSPAAPLNDQAGDAEATMTPETPLHSANPKTHRMQCHHARLASGTSSAGAQIRGRPRSAAPSRELNSSRGPLWLATKLDKSHNVSPMLRSWPPAGARQAHRSRGPVSN